MYLSNLAVELILLPAADYFLHALQQVVAEMAAEMAAKTEMLQGIHLQLQAVVGKDWCQLWISYILTPQNTIQNTLNMVYLQQT